VAGGGMTGRSDAVVGEAVGVVVDAVVGAAARGGERARVRERERERERDREREREREDRENGSHVADILSELGAKIYDAELGATTTPRQPF
jgi:hypothetical protein